LRGGKLSAIPAKTRPSLLFDLDGTLVDSAPDLAAALNRLLAEEGRSALGLDQVKAMIGDGVAKLVERAVAATGPAFEAPELARAVARYSAYYEAAASVETRPFPGVVATLDGLIDAGWGLAVCTNKPQAATLAVLKDLNLAPYFESVVGGDALPVRKPDGGHLLGALERMAGAPERAVMVGDGRNDVLAARDAGIPVVLVSYGYGAQAARRLGPDRVIDAFAELPAALAGLLEA
jgi:phosphoglycolate phosphatase